MQDGLLFATLVGVLWLYKSGVAHGSAIPRALAVGDASSNFIGPSVKTTSGLVLGARLDVAHAFYRIPYAAPPVGDLRFKDPQPVAKATDAINATYNDYLVCYQARKECSEGRCFTNLKEDCLVLNIHVPLHVDLSDPNDAPTSRLPVYFYIHGGFFHLGGGTGQRYDGRWLSNVANSVVVTINYRLGAFGSLLYGDGDKGFPGNQGLKDQRMAMQWVQENIEKFGGDKNKVTIGGNSAGGQSVMFHMVSQLSRPLFKRAIVMSCPNYIYRSRRQESKKAEFITELLNCTEDKMKCLREASPQRLVEILPSLRQKLDEVEAGNSQVQPFRPFIDGEEFPNQPISMFRDGLWHKEKEIMLGTTLEELYGRRYIAYKGDIDEEKLLSINVAYFGEEIGRAATDKYKKMLQEGDENYNKIFERQIADVTFDCPTRATARFVVKTSREKNVHLYTSAFAPSGPKCDAVNDDPTRCGSPYHASEIGEIFRSAPSFGYSFDVAVADQFSTYWGSFFRSGDPSNGLEVSVRNVSNWPAYTGKPWPSIQIQSPRETVRNGYSEDACDFWDSQDYYVKMPNSGGRSELCNAMFVFILAFSFVSQ